MAYGSLKIYFTVFITAQSKITKEILSKGNDP